MRTTLFIVAALVVLAVASYYTGGRELLEALTW